MKQVNFMFLIMLAVFFLILTESAEAIYPLNQQDPSTAGFSLGGEANASRGWRFRVNESGLCITQLGVNSRISDSESHTVTLFDFNTQEVLAQVATTPAPGWVFEDLDTPIALTQGSEYIISAHSVSGDWYYYGSRNNVGDTWFPTGEIEYLDMRFNNSPADPSDFPAQVLNNYQYGIPDFNYEICGDEPPASIPTLNEWGMIIFTLLLGCSALWYMRRRSLA